MIWSFGYFSKTRAFFCFCFLRITKNKVLNLVVLLNFSLNSWNNYRVLKRSVYGERFKKTFSFGGILKNPTRR